MSPDVSYELEREKAAADFFVGNLVVRLVGCWLAIDELSRMRVVLTILLVS